MNRSLLLITAALLILITQSGASCVSDGGSEGGSSGSGGGGTGYRPYDSNTNQELPSRARPRRLPRSADVVREGTGKLKWKADMDGTAYVYDSDKETIQYTGPLRRGEELTVQPSDDRISIGAKAVSIENLEKRSFHQIYFAPTQRDDRRDDRRNR